MHRLAIVSPLLLIPPIGVRIAELTLDWGRVDIAAVLREIISYLPVLSPGAATPTISGSSAAVRFG